MGREPRSPERIEPMLDKLREAWQLYPDMRLGQLIVACAGTANIFGIEDDVLSVGLQQYIDSMQTALERISGKGEVGIK